MKQLLLIPLLLLSLFISPCWATLSAGVGSADTGTTQPIVTTSIATQATGSGLIVTIVWDSGQNFTSIADNKGNSSNFVQLGTEFNAGGTKARQYYVLNALGGSGHQVTVTLDATSHVSVFVKELKTTNGSGVTLDQLGVFTTTAVSPYLSPTITTTIANEILYAAGFGNGGSVDTWTPGASFTMDAGENVTNGALFWTGAQGYRVVSSTGTYNSSWTAATSTSTVQMVVSFSEAGGAAPALGYQRRRVQ